MNPLYNTGIYLYSAAASLAAKRSPKVARMIAGQRLAVPSLELARKEKAPDGFDVWVHAASLGEFEQARPLIDRLRAQRPELSVLLTFFSPSGYEVRKHYPQVDVVTYLPFDKPALVRRFLDAAKPKMAIFVKYEFWGNYLEQLHARGIPTYIISAIFRPQQAFFKPYGSMMRHMLHLYTHLYVQDDASRSLLQSVGVTNVTVAGDTRFDRVTDVMRSTTTFPVIEQWIELGQEPVLIAGSSWQPDEACYIPYLNAHPEIKAIIAPHEFDAGRLRALQSQLQRPSVLLSEAEKTKQVPEDTQTVIVDSFGKLSSLYRYGQVALIGGGFGAGIHNINEAAVYGMPVVFGPKHHKFKEAADLIACGGGFEYTSQHQLELTLSRLFDPSTDARAKAGAEAGKYIREHLGATDKIFSDLFV